MILCEPILYSMVVLLPAIWVDILKSRKKWLHLHKMVSRNCLLMTIDHYLVMTSHMTNSRDLWTMTREGYYGVSLPVVNYTKAIYGPNSSYLTHGINHKHDDVIKWKHFPRNWPFVRGIHRFPTQRPVTRSFDVFFDLRLNKWLRKQP